jgi:predicted nucleotidyltransferase
MTARWPAANSEYLSDGFHNFAVFVDYFTKLQIFVILRNSNNAKMAYICNMDLKQSIHNSMQEFISLCKKHNVQSLYAFGSSVNGEFDEQSSDFDFLVEVGDVDPVQKGENLLAIWDKFEQLFQRKIDLLTESSIRNPVLKRTVDRTKVLIYDGKKQKVFI